MARRYSLLSLILGLALSACAPPPEKYPAALLSIKVAPERKAAFFEHSKAFSEAGGFVFARSTPISDSGIPDTFQAARIDSQIIGVKRPLSEEYQVGFYRTILPLGASKGDLRTMAKRYSADLQRAGFRVEVRTP